jgi:hypothetical protein
MKPTNTTTIQLSHQTKPPPRAWSQWKKLYQILANQNHLRLPLGSWLDWKQRQWHYLSDDKTIYDSINQVKSTEIHYGRVYDIVTQWEPPHTFYGTPVDAINKNLFTKPVLIHSKEPTPTSNNIISHNQRKYCTQQKQQNKCMVAIIKQLKKEQYNYVIEKCLTQCQQQLHLLHIASSHIDTHITQIIIKNQQIIQTLEKFHQEMDLNPSIYIQQDSVYLEYICQKMLQRKIQITTEDND